MATKKTDSDKPRRRIIPRWISIHLIVITVAIVWILFLQDNNIFKSYDNKQQITELHEEIKKIKDSTEVYKTKLRELDSEPEALEKVAREKYQMKNEKEDVFITDIK